MIDGLFVIDAVVHPFNNTPENDSNGYGEVNFRTNFGLHNTWNPPELRVPEHVFRTNWTPEQLSRTLFRESGVDMAVNHHLPLYSWWKDGHVSRAKNIELAERWPDRYILYAGCDPMRGPDACVRVIDEQVQEVPKPLSGLKLYPAQVDPFRSFRMDDVELMRPIYERCIEHGFRSVAVHKAIPVGAIPMEPFRIDDVEGAATAFPELNFEIIHTGLAFLEETALACARYPNVYANLETTFMLATCAPGRFEEIIAHLAFWAGMDKICFSSGTMYGHARPILERFLAFEFSQATMSRYGLAQITREDKSKILGENYARLIGLDLAEAGERIADDEFARYQRENGLDEPYSNWIRDAAPIR